MPQHENYWEFKHPLFRRGDIASLSQIKKSAHFEENSTNSQVAQMGESVNELKAHVWTLNQRMSNLDSVVDTLTLSLRDLHMRQPMTELSNAPMLDSTYVSNLPLPAYTSIPSATAVASETEDMSRKRKPTLSRQASVNMKSDGFEDESFWDFAAALSLENMESIAAYEYSSLSATVASDATDSTSQFLALYGGSSGPVASYPSFTSSLGSHSSASNSGEQKNGDEDNAMNSLRLSQSNMVSLEASMLPTDTPASVPVFHPTYLSDDVSSVPSVQPSVQPFMQPSTSFPAPASVDFAVVQKGDQLAETLGVKDIPDILRLLPESLQGRFVDRLAEVVGSRMSSTAQTDSVKSPAVAVQAAATVVAPESTKPYWEAYASPSSVPVATYHSSQPVSLPVQNNNISSQPTNSLTPVTAFSHTNNLPDMSSDLCQPMTADTPVHPPVSAASIPDNNVMSIALGALVAQFQLAASTLQDKGATSSNTTTDATLGKLCSYY